MKEVPHPHVCLCARRWYCQNQHCGVGELTACRTPKCTKAQELRRLVWLEDQLDVVGQYAEHMRQMDETTLADEFMRVRAALIARVEEESKKMAAATEAGR